MELGDGLVRGSDGRLEAVGHELGLPQRAAARCGEHQCLPISRAAGQVDAQLLGERARQPHRPRFMGLDPTPLQMPSDLRRGLDHPDRPAQQVEAADLERHELARSQTGVASDPDQRAIRWGDGLGQRLDLGGGQEVHLLALDLGQPDPLGHVAGQPPAIHRARQDL
jgi:hypothetical protein